MLEVLILIRTFRAGRRSYQEENVLLSRANCKKGAAWVGLGSDKGSTLCTSASRVGAVYQISVLYLIHVLL